MYICIPLEHGENDANVKRVDAIKRDLIAAGHDPVSPIQDVRGYPAKIGKCIEDLLSCKAIYVAGDWKKCKRCSCEFFVAQAHKLKVFFGPERITALYNYTIPHADE